MLGKSLQMGNIPELECVCGVSFALITQTIKLEGKLGLILATCSNWSKVWITQYYAKLVVVIFLRFDSPCTTSVKFCSFVPMELLATHTYTPESFTIRPPRVYCSVSICELPDMVLRTTSPSSSLLLISTKVTGGTASTVHSRSRLVFTSLLTTPDKNWRTGITKQWEEEKGGLKLYLHSY